MTLFEYAEKCGEDIPALAQRMGLHRSHLYNIASGKRGFNTRTAAAIARATDGRVTANDLMRVREEFLATQETAAA